MRKEHNFLVLVFSVKLLGPRLPNPWKYEYERIVITILPIDFGYMTNLFLYF